MSSVESICPENQFHRLDRVGKQLMRGAADQMKRLSLELGGHAPFVVFPDADPEAVAKAAVIGKFRNNGRCAFAEPVLRSQGHLEEIHRGDRRMPQGAKNGHGLNAGVEVGPMFEKKALESTRQLIDDATGRGAKVLTGGKKSSAASPAATPSRSGFFRVLQFVSTVGSKKLAAFETLDFSRGQHLGPTASRVVDQLARRFQALFSRTSARLRRQRPDRCPFLAPWRIRRSPR